MFSIERPNSTKRRTTTRATSRAATTKPTTTEAANIFDETTVTMAELFQQNEDVNIISNDEVKIFDQETLNKNKITGFTSINNQDDYATQESGLIIFIFI